MTSPWVDPAKRAVVPSPHPSLWWDGVEGIRTPSHDTDAARPVFLVLECPGERTLRGGDDLQERDGAGLDVAQQTWRPVLGNGLMGLDVPVAMATASAARTHL